MLDQEACDAQGGTYLGDDSTCQDDSDSDSIADCLDQCPGGDDRIDQDGNQIPDCLEGDAIPTVSQWGLVILAMLLLIAARANHRRQARPAV